MASSTDAAPGVPMRAFVGLGANLGEPGRALRQALVALAGLPRTRVRACSRHYRSAPIEASGPDFINAVAMLETGLSPRALLASLHEIEAAAGRERGQRNAPRTLDLDLLLYAARELHDTDIQLPHPRLAERAFVLRPLFELAPELTLPDGRMIAGCAARITGQRLTPLDHA
ncbi:MAG: 2-amino-4-hydroxy-6-hydroxymethyldihydropteridine diphosphokinase [Burkholderiaceae bacterium]